MLFKFSHTCRSRFNDNDDNLFYSNYDSDSVFII